MNNEMIIKLFKFLKKKTRKKKIVAQIKNIKYNYIFLVIYTYYIHRYSFIS